MHSYLQNNDLALRREPVPELFVHCRMTEQVPVIHAITNPLPGFGKRHGHSGVLMAAQCAVKGHQSVPEKLATQVTDLRPSGRGNRVTPYSFR